MVSLDAQTDCAIGNVNSSVGDMIFGTSSNSNPFKEVRYKFAVVTIVKREDTVGINKTFP